MRTEHLIFPRQVEQDNLFLYLASALRHVKRTTLRRAFEKGHIQVNDIPAKPDRLLQPGDRITLILPEARPAIVAEPITLDILAEDSSLLIINKPAGMPCHRGLGHHRGTLLNALAYHYANTGQADALSNGLVHRLDKNTSGMMVIAKDSRTFRHLQNQFRNKTVRKTYHAVVPGLPSPPEGLIDVPVGRDPNNHHHIRTFAKGQGGREALTRYRVISTCGDMSLLMCEPLTGRTHQIRLHLAHIGHPVAGDTRYGEVQAGLDRHLLHASNLVFTHPATGEEVLAEAPLPDLFLPFQKD